MSLFTSIDKFRWPVLNDGVVVLSQYYIQAPVLFAGRLPAKLTRAVKH